MDNSKKPKAQARDSVTNRLLVYSENDIQNFTLPKKMEWREAGTHSGKTYFILKKK